VVTTVKNKYHRRFGAETSQIKQSKCWATALKLTNISAIGIEMPTNLSNVIGIF